MLPPPETWIETPPTTPNPDLIAGLLPHSGATLIVGEAEVGKTLIALEVAWAILTGEKLWGWRAPQMRGSLVSYILGEHSTEGLCAEWRQMGLTVPPRTLRVIGPEHRLPLVVVGHLNRGTVERYQRWCQGSQLVVWDPLGAYVEGAGAESDNTAMRHLVNAMVEVGSGAATLILHHMGKGGEEGRHPPKYAARGASAIEDAAVAVWYVAPERESYRDPEGYRLTRVKYKGEAPRWIRVHRAGLRHGAPLRGGYAEGP